MSASGGGSLMDLFVEIRAENPKLAADLEAAQAKILKSGEETQAKLRAMMLRQQLEMKSLGNPGTDKYNNQTAAQRAQWESLWAGSVHIAMEMTKAQNAVDRKMASIQKYAEKVAAATVNVKALGQAEASTAAVQEKAAATSGKGVAASDKDDVATAKKRAFGFVLITQAVEDMQYGFNAVVNNIPGIVMAFGGSGGLAGGLALASVAVNQLINNWSYLKDQLGVGGTLTEAEAMNKLAEATSRTAEETLKLAKYKEREATAAAMAGSKTKAEESQAEGVKKAFGEAGYGAVKKGLTESARDILTRTDAGARDAKAAADYYDKTYVKPSKGKAPIFEKELVRLRALENDAVDAAAVKMMADAALTPGGLKKMMNAVSKNPGAFPEGLGDKLSIATPEAFAEAADKKKADDKRAKSDRRLEQAKIEKDFDDSVIGDISKAVGPMAYGISSGFSERITRNLASDLLKTGKESNPESARKTAEKVVADAADKLTEAAKEMVLSGKARTVAEAEKTIGLEEMVKEAEKRKSEAAKLIDDFKPKISDIGGYLNSLQTNVGGDPRLVVAEKALRKAEDALAEHKATNEKLTAIAMKETGMWR